MLPMVHRQHGVPCPLVGIPWIPGAPIGPRIGLILAAADLLSDEMGVVSLGGLFLALTELAPAGGSSPSGLFALDMSLFL